MPIVKSHEERLKNITRIEQQLSEIKDVDILLENILAAACEIVHADAGSIYDFDDIEQTLRIKYSQTATLQKALKPGEKLPYTSFTFHAKDTIAGYTALTKKILNIPDVYNMGPYLDAEKTEKRTFSFNSQTDRITGYHTKSMLVVPLTMTNGRVLGVLQIINAQDANGNVISFDDDDVFYISHFATTVGQVYEYAYLTKQLIERLVRMAGFRDPRETGAHVERVSSFAVEIYDRYAGNKGISEKERNKFRDTLKLAAKCHDVGKVAIPDGILKKEGPLSDDERAIMKGHTLAGAQIFTPIESPLDEMARDVCLHHHDRYDGNEKGYPGECRDYMEYEPGGKVSSTAHSFKGTDIPLAARIVAIADVYDALRHRRSYKAPWDENRTFEIIKEESGKQFDPELVEAFLQIRERIEAINSSIS